MTSIREQKNDGSQELSLEIQKANYFATAAKENWISMVSFAVFILVWELICQYEIIGPYQLVPPSEVITVFFEKFTQVNAALLCAAIRHLCCPAKPCCSGPRSSGHPRYWR